MKNCHIFKKNKNGHFIFGFFGSDPSKMDQTRKFGEQTSRILEFKPEGLDFQYKIKALDREIEPNGILTYKMCKMLKIRNRISLIFNQ